MRNLTMFGVAAIAVTAAIGVQAQDKDPRTGRKPPQIPQTIPPSPFPGSATPSSTPGPVINQPGPFNGPSVPLRVIVRGDGGVRWDAQFCGTADGENIRTCQSGANQGSLVRFDVEPRPGMSFTGWGGDCLKSGSTNTAYTCILSATKPLDVVAGFAPKSVSVGKVQISVKIAEASGKVETAPFSEGQINCGLFNPGPAPKGGIAPPITQTIPCDMAVDVGTQVSLIAKPDPGSVFRFWNKCPNPTGNTCNFAATKSMQISAYFGKPGGGGKTGAGGGNPSNTPAPKPVYTVTVLTGEKGNDRSWASAMKVKEMFICNWSKKVTSCVGKVYAGTLRINGEWKSKTTNTRTRWAKAKEWGNCPSPHDQYCDITVNSDVTLSLK